MARTKDKAKFFNPKPEKKEEEKYAPRPKHFSLWAILKVSTISPYHKLGTNSFTQSSVPLILGSVYSSITLWSAPVH